MGRVFVGECEREEACVHVEWFKCVNVDGQSNTQRACCPKLVNQPSAKIYTNSRPP